MLRSSSRRHVRAAAVVSAAALTVTLAPPGPAQALGAQFTVGLRYPTTDTIEIYSDQWTDTAIDDVITVTVVDGQLLVHNAAADVTGTDGPCRIEGGDARCDLGGVTGLYVRLGWGHDSFDSSTVGQLDVEVPEQSPSDPNSRTVSTGGGDDLVRGGYARNTLSTGGGNDTVYPGSGADTFVQAGPGNDRLFNEGRRQHLDGGSGNDVIQTFCGGWQAGSVLTDSGQTGTDTINASLVLDPVKVVGTGIGTNMRCALRGDMTKSLLFGGRIENVRLGHDYLGDTVDLAKMTAPRGRLTWNLGGGSDEFTGPQAGFPVTVLGTGGDDLVITGPPSNDLVRGGSGNDQLVDAGGRSDDLYGEGGRDGLGGRDRKADLLHGGVGGDYCFDSPRWAQCEAADRKVSIENR